MSAIKCPFCGHAASGVTDSRPHVAPDTTVRRRRECDRCSARFTTFETAVYDDNTWADRAKVEALANAQRTGLQFPQGVHAEGRR